MDTHLMIGVAVMLGLIGIAASRDLLRRLREQQPQLVPIRSSVRMQHGYTRRDAERRVEAQRGALRLLGHGARQAVSQGFDPCRCECVRRTVTASASISRGSSSEHVRSTSGLTRCQLKLAGRQARAARQLFEFVELQRRIQPAARRLRRKYQRAAVVHVDQARVGGGRHDHQSHAFRLRLACRVRSIRPPGTSVRRSSDARSRAGGLVCAPACAAGWRRFSLCLGPPLPCAIRTSRLPAPVPVPFSTIFEVARAAARFRRAR